MEAIVGITNKPLFYATIVLLFSVNAVFSPVCCTGLRSRRLRLISFISLFPCMIRIGCFTRVICAVRDNNISVWYYSRADLFSLAVVYIRLFVFSTAYPLSAGCHHAAHSDLLLTRTTQTNRPLCRLACIKYL